MLAEQALALVIIGFYVTDAIVFLAESQVIIRAGWSGWQVRFPSADFTLLGRRVYVPNLLAPGQAVFRVRWAPERPEDDLPAAAPLADGRDALFLKVAVNLLMALFILLVVELLATSRFDQGTLLRILEIYLVACVGLVWLWRRRERYRIGTGQFLSLALDCLLCIPHSVNLLRKLTLHAARNAELLASLNDLCAKDGLGPALESVAVELDRRIRRAGPDSPHVSGWRRYRAELSRQQSSP